MIRRKTSSASPKADVRAASVSSLSLEMEARIAQLPASWQDGCREVMEQQSPELQLIQIVMYEGLVSLADSLSCPPRSLIIKEVVNESPRLEDELNLDGWFRDYEEEEEEEEDEYFDDDVSQHWFPDQWRPSSGVEVNSELPHLLPDNLGQVTVFSVVVEDAPTIVHCSALPILTSSAMGS